MNKSYNIIVTIKPWNIIFFKKNLKKLKGNWILITKKTDLTLNKLKKINVKNIYFIHWSNIVSSSIYKKFNCISFHMTDLPYGRGGSPLQNLIIRKKKVTKISAFKMNNKIDGGPIYLKRKLKLSGSALKIFNNTSKIIFGMIKEIEKNKINPKPQNSSRIIFKRLSKKENDLNISNIKGLNEMYDRIRMVDAPSYPHAYAAIDHFKFEFYKIKKIKKILYCSVKISLKKNKN
jgi:methionyl-tRNA formyltransferase